MSLISDAVDTIVSALASAAGQSIVIKWAAGDATIVGVFRRTPVDWRTPDGNVSGSGWQVVTTVDEVGADNLADLAGTRITVDGYAYYIVRYHERNGGGLILELGYAAS